ncbi:MAG TPA: hypothetical protein VIW80_17800 [Pyrinomonadaceae bacterium]|jgi:hypothetical protein
MRKKEERLELEERLDRAGRALVRASASASEREADAVASAPFLYTRVRARIAAERERREAGERWLALSIVMRRAVLAMSLVAVVSLSVFLFARVRTDSARGFSDESFFDARSAGVERVLFADREPLSNDEVLATIMSDEREATK